MPEIVFTEAAIDDLRRIGPEAAPKVLRKILLLLTDPKAGYPLGGELTGYRKLVVGRNTWRIVYRITEDARLEICEVWAVGARADTEVYSEAAARVAAARSAGPDMVRLRQVVERLGRLAGGITVEPSAKPREPVPEWLADRLIHSAGMAREAVAALELREAVDLWTAFSSRHPGA